jgi:iron complex outermembrane receptor protein
VSTGDSRGVEFDQYPAELLSGVTIYKTPDGALVGQGLAGTADMLTVRPLDFGKRTIALNARKTKSGVGLEKEGDGTRSSASYIDQFANRTIGIALGAARLKDNGAATTRFSSWGSGTTQYNGATVNVPYNGVEGWTAPWRCCSSARTAISTARSICSIRSMNTTAAATAGRPA